MRIGLDIMGSDSSPELLYQAGIRFADELPEGDQLVVYCAKPYPYHPSIIQVAVADEILMDDDPLTSIRRKRDSSIVRGIQQLKRGEIDAFVTTGNTGAVVAASALTLNRFPGIEKPSLLAELPTAAEKNLAVIDVGGSVATSPEHLVQYAHMGSVYQRCRLGISRPKVGLLNIGAESGKGTPVVRQAYRMMREKENGFEFVGNVEARDIFSGGIDVLVTDGFTGNVLLKSAEGTVSFICDYLGKELSDEQLSHFRYDSHPGAIVAGVEGIVIKCHGYTSSKGVYRSLNGASALIANRLIPTMAESL